MKLRIWSCVLTIFTLLAVVNIAKSQDIVLLGDSQSDNGNGYAAFVKFVLETNDTYPQEPYYDGRWSNGPVWIEIAAKQLGVNLTNFAAGGATTGAAAAGLPPLQPPFAGLTLPTAVLSPTLGQQLNSLFLQTNSVLSPDPIYILLIGVNDYLSTVQANATITNSIQPVVMNIEAVVGKMYDQGARKFVISGIPMVSKTPQFTQPQSYGFYDKSKIQAVDALVAAHNKEQQQFVNHIPTLYPGASASFFDYVTAVSTIQQNAQAYGITNLQDACYFNTPNLTVNDEPAQQPIGAAGGILCSDPDAHFFWDQSHNSRVVHEFVGATFTQQLGYLFPGKAGASQSPALGPNLPTLPFSSPQPAGE